MTNFVLLQRVKKFKIIIILAYETSGVTHQKNRQCLETYKAIEAEITLISLKEDMINIQWSIYISLF
jgi:hypothetical protein